MAESALSMGQILTSWATHALDPRTREELVRYGRAIGVAEGVFLDQLGLPALAQAIAHRELMRAQVADPRISDVDMQRAVLRAAQTQTLLPRPLRLLCGVTRLVDEKITLSDAVFQRLQRDVDPVVTRDLIDAGPASKEWAFARPHSREELLASLVRQMVCGAGASRHIVLSQPLYAWLQQCVVESSATTSMALGGAAAFVANLAQAFSTVQVSFFSQKPLPRSVAERFSSRMHVIDEQAKRHPVAEYVSDESVRINCSMEYGKGLDLPLFGQRMVAIHGRQHALTTGGTGRVIFGTEAADVAPSLVDDEHVIAQLAQQHDVLFFVGAHYVTRLAEREARQAAARLALQWRNLKKANPDLWIHLQYVTPKNRVCEDELYSEIVGAFDSVALNAVEVAQFVEVLDYAGLLTQPFDVHVARTRSEEPGIMLAGARMIRQALGLKRVHVHGYQGDLVVEDAATSLGTGPRGVFALLRARQLASNKAMNPTGEIRGPHDVWATSPTVFGSGLVALYQCADAARAAGLSDDEHHLMLRDWFVEKSGERVTFVPSRGIYAFDGGTVSLGDTIDGTALMFARGA